MSSFDKITGDYNLQTISGTCGSGDISITAANGLGNIVLNGNLYVIGTIANIQTSVTYVADNYIRVSTESAGIPVTHAGLQVERGDECTVEIRWNEIRNRWEFTEDCVTFYPFLGKIKQDLAPVLGGDLKVSSKIDNELDPNLGCFQIQSDYPCNIVLNPGIDKDVTRGALELRQIDPLETPNWVSGSTTFYAKPPELCGDTGFFIRQPNRSDQLISKRMAAVFSLVL